jgi:hypothetical protein
LHRIWPSDLWPPVWCDLLTAALRGSSTATRYGMGSSAMAILGRLWTSSEEDLPPILPSLSWRLLSCPPVQ